MDILGVHIFRCKQHINQQDHGCAMGLPVNPIIANLYMESFEVKAITSSPHPLTFWMRYVDGTFVVINKDYAQQFTDHINSLNQHIKFTKDLETEGTLSSLDTLVKRQADGSLKVNVYRNQLIPVSTFRFNPTTHWSTNLVCSWLYFIVLTRL